MGNIDARHRNACKTDMDAKKVNKELIDAEIG